MTKDPFNNGQPLDPLDNLHPRPNISSGESDERAVSVTEWIRNNYQDHTTVDSLCDALDRFLAALATQPAESKACASVGVEPIYAVMQDGKRIAIASLRENADYAAHTSPGATVVPCQLVPLASPAPSVGEPAAEVQEMSNRYGTVKAALLIDKSLPPGTKLYATPPAAPAATEGVIQVKFEDNFLTEWSGSIPDGTYTLAAPAAAVPESPADKTGTGSGKS